MVVCDSFDRLRLLWSSTTASIVIPVDRLRWSSTTASIVIQALIVSQMVQAVIVFEDMIKTEYLRNMWWYWSSLTAAAKISTLSSLALRIYSLDASIDYEKISSNFGQLKLSRKPGQKPRSASDATQKLKLGSKLKRKRED